MRSQYNITYILPYAHGSFVMCKIGWIAMHHSWCSWIQSETVYLLFCNFYHFINICMSLSHCSGYCFRCRLLTVDPGSTVPIHQNEYENARIIEGFWKKNMHWHSMMCRVKGCLAILFAFTHIHVVVIHTYRSSSLVNSFHRCEINKRFNKIATTTNADTNRFMEAI